MTDTQQTPPQGAAVPAVRQEEKWLKVIESNKNEFQKALGSAIPVEFFNRVAITSIRKTPLLAQCSIPSLIGELMSCAQIQLTPDGVLGEAYLVPFYNSQLRGYEAKLMIGYKGVVKLIRRNNEVLNLTADIVRENDKFVYRKGTKRELSHEPLLKGDRGDWLGAYAYVEYTNGGSDFTFVEAQYIERVKASSKGSDKPDSPWNIWPEPQWCKTAIKQLTKIADISPQTREALAKDLDLGAIDVESTVSHATSVTEPTRLLRDEQAETEATAKAEAKKAEPEKPRAAAPPKVAPAPAPAPAAKPAPAPAPAATQQPAPPAPKPAAPPPKPPTKPPAPAAPPAAKKKPTLVESPLTAEDLARQNEEYMRQMGMAPAAAPAAPQQEIPEEGDPFAPGQPEQPQQGEAGLGDTLFPD